MTQIWKLLKRIFVMGLLLAGSISAWSAETVPSTGIRVGSLEWQRIDFENKLQERLHQAVSKLIPDRLFTITVGISLKPIEAKPPTDQKDNTAEDNRISLGKLDFDTPIGPDEEDTYIDSLGERRRIRSINLFSQLDKVNIAILLDNSVQDNRKELIQKLVKGITAPFGESTTSISLDKAELYNPKQFAEPWDTTRWVTELKIPIAILSATLILVLFLTLVLSQAFRGYFSIQSRKTALLESKDAREAAVDEAKLAALNPIAPSMGATSSDTIQANEAKTLALKAAAENGFDRFKALLSENPEKMADLVRQWVRAPGRGTTEALVMLPQILSTAECLQLFKFLKEDDRKEWKKALSTPIDENGSKIAENFIAFQIVDSLLNPPATQDDELQKLLSSISLADCVEIATQDTNLGALLLDLLPTTQAGRLYSIMNRDLADGMAAAVMRLSKDEVTAQSSNLKQAIQNVINNKRSVPFHDRAAELVNSVGPDREENILKALAESGEFQLLEATAKQFFPSELILKLPSAAIKACLERYPNARRAEIILSRAEADRTILLESIGKTNSKARELIDIEIQNIEVDEIRKRRIEKSQGLIWRDFISTVRNLVITNDTVSELSKDILSQWLSEKTAGQYRGSNAENAA